MATCTALPFAARGEVGTGDAARGTRSLVEQALAYEHGEGVPRDPVEAARLYCEAARAGDPEAQYSLGWIYANGRGVSRDEAFASGLFQLASASGHAHAARLLDVIRDPNPALPPCMTEIAADGAADQAGDPAEDPFVDLPANKQRLAELVRSLAPRFEVDPILALAVVRAESNFEPAARSPKNAQGLMQLIPETAERFRVRNAFDPADNIRGGLAYLRWLLAYYRGRVEFALAAYNAGEAAVDRYRGVPPYPETRAYVIRVKRYFQNDFHPYNASVADPSPAIVSGVLTRTR